MNEVIERLMLNEPIQEVLIAGRAPPTNFFDPRLARPPGALRAIGTWTSSLGAADLACLLQVIESELIPQLVRGYSPARCSPQELSP